MMDCIAIHSAAHTSTSTPMTHCPSHMGTHEPPLLAAGGFVTTRLTIISVGTFTAIFGHRTIHDLHQDEASLKMNHGTHWRGTSQKTIHYHLL